MREFGRELHRARLAAGLSQAEVARSVHLSKSTISRMERGLPPLPDFVVAARVARVVGLDLSIRYYPAPGQLRDAPHIALIQRFLARIPPSVRRHLEAPIKPGDLRAWDVLLVIGAVRIGVVAETRIRDLQALLRREHRKQLDGNVDHILLLVSDTSNNRLAIAESGALIGEAFPLGTRAVMARLSRGEPVNANGLVVL